MPPERKTKISITVSESVLARVDREAERTPGATRSSVIDEWLRRAAGVRARAALDDATIAYYGALDEAARAEDAAWAAFATGELSRSSSRRPRRAPRR